MKLTQKTFLGVAPVPRLRRLKAAFSLIEVLVSMLVVGIMLGGLFSLYTQSAVRAEWSAYSLAGHLMAMRGLEQARAAKWDPRAAVPVDDVVPANFPVVVDVLDLGPGGTGVTYATNVTQIQNVSTNPLLKLIRVDCTWTFPRLGRTSTNTIFTCRAPDQ